MHSKQMIRTEITGAMNWGYSECTKQNQIKGAPGDERTAAMGVVNTLQAT